jgi:hypothetical protein
MVVSRNHSTDTIAMVNRVVPDPREVVAGDCIVQAFMASSGATTQVDTIIGIGSDSIGFVSIVAICTIGHAQRINGIVCNRAIRLVIVLLMMVLLFAPLSVCPASQ